VPGQSPGTPATPVPRLASVVGRISLEAIAEASELIDPVFRDTPQFVSEPLSELLGATVVLKVETLNPIRSFKGRGTDYLLHRIEPPPAGLVCASAGNFGQGLAYACRKRGVRVTVFAAENATSLKVQRMRALGAEVVLRGKDFDAAKEHARAHAAATNAMFVEDGQVAAIAEGAGTIALELCRMAEPLDVVLVPLGDGALVSGIGAWMKRAMPSVRVVGVVASGAPAMQLSWRAGRVVTTESMSTIADGIAVRAPVPEALEDMKGTVDDVVAVDDDEIRAAMRLLFSHAGLAAEAAGAAGLAAVKHTPGMRAAVIVTGGNLSDEQMRALLP